MSARASAGVSQVTVSFDEVTFRHGFGSELASARARRNRASCRSVYMSTSVSAAAFVPASSLPSIEVPSVTTRHGR